MNEDLNKYFEPFKKNLDARELFKQEELNGLLVTSPVRRRGMLKPIVAGVFALVAILIGFYLLNPGYNVSANKTKSVNPVARVLPNQSKPTTDNPKIIKNLNKLYIEPKKQKLLASIDKGNPERIAKVDFPAVIENNPDIKEMTSSDITTLDLTKDELKNIGITYKNGKYNFDVENYYDFDKGSWGRLDLTDPDSLKRVKENFYSKGYDTTIKKGIFRFNEEIDKGNLIEKVSQFNGWDMDNSVRILPICGSIASENYVYNSTKNQYEIKNKIQTFGSYNLVMSYNKLVNLIDNLNNGQYREKLYNLIPVHISVSDTTSKDSSKFFNNDIYIWYLASHQFASLLPERYRKPIMQELDLISKIQDCKVEPDEACDALSGENSFFDICRSNASSIRYLDIYPNPNTGGNIFVKCYSMLQSVISVTLLDFRGRQVEKLCDNISMNYGDNSFQFNLPVNLEPGIYMLLIDNRNGEHVVQKLIIQ